MSPENLDPRTELSLATGAAAQANVKHWRAGTITWGEVLRWPEHVSKTKDGAGSYVFGELAVCRCPDCGGKTEKRMRNATSVINRSVLTLDVDHPAEDFIDAVELLVPWAGLVHTTFSSAPDEPRYRILLPLSRSVAPDEYHALASIVMERLGVESFDSGSLQPWRYMFKPAARRPEWFSSLVLEGPALPVEELLADYDPDLSTLPAPKPSRNKRDPFTLEGTLGAFNRAYTIPEVIEAYELPYEPAGDARWGLIGARSVAGLSEVGPGLAFSHHVTDPAHGQTCSAFDLVRLHRFGELDEGLPAQTPVNRRPSQEAMLELASTDARVLAELVGPDFQVETDDDEPRDWRTRLTRNRAGTAIRDTISNWDLVTDNDPIFKGLRFNEFSLAIETEADLPWRPLSQGGPVFGTNDRHELGDRLEREHGTRPTTARLDAMVSTVAHRRYYNPVRAYLDALRWDGKKRMETSLPGVKPNRYTRMVARKSLVAAVARAIEPGIKWDHTLVLYGPEGIGKSYWVDKMARGYSASLGRIGDKDTLLTMQRSWIMTADEGFSLRKADADVQKEFLTRREDVFRMPYDREAVAHPRHCVIWATTNDETFLRRQEGNRRFLIVRCETKVNFNRITDEYVDQVWAEAVHAYRTGERLYLTDEESLIAADEREAFTEEDALTGLIAEYLDTPVPEDWEELTPEARMAYRENLANGMVAPGPARITRTCTSALWVEALGRRLGEHRRADLIEVSAALKQLPDWRPLSGRHRVLHYGPQLVFERHDEDVL